MESWNPEANEIFLKASEIPSPAGRRAYLDAACSTELRGQVESLLEANDQSTGFLERLGPALAAIAVEPPGEIPGALIGPYKLLQQIGEGGMGTVYMAEQTHPVQRKVALKVIKPGMDSRQVIARFEAERQALAMMDHVNIARVLDAGTTESGLPYFVMELVHGVPITKYCDDNHLTPRERLELFVPVCQAIQHAHQKGIIHRDIKPSNVMITLYDGKPVPKVIDFGVAKATEQRLTERTLFTQYGAMVGTLEYMSPEQAEMSALGVDTRSDIYLAGCAAVRVADGQHAALSQAGQGGSVCRDSPHDQRGGAAQTEYSAERLGRGAGVHLGPSPHGAGQVDEAHARRVGLDRDEDSGEGPQPPLRDGQGLRRRRAALFERRGGARVSAIGHVPVAKTRASAQRAGAGGFLARVGTVGRYHRHDVGHDPGDRRGSRGRE